MECMEWMEWIDWVAKKEKQQTADAKHEKQRINIMSSKERDASN